MEYMKFRERRPSLDNEGRANAGFTIPEVVVAAALVAIFFSSIFEINALCLRYISASKENVGAIEAVQDRLERLRNTAFTTLTTVSSMKSLLATPANSSPIAQRAVETVIVSDYPSGVPTITYTRSANGTVTSVPSTADFSNSTLVQVDLTNQWPATFGNRTGSAQTSTVISAGTKK
jgi:prepilin-type N-terminal cleavage/methylation domain-containing protein